MSNQIDRALEILLLLRRGKTLSATALAKRFEVSSRTIYRDIETLSAAGVPVYAEMGREGGFRLLEGYFLPPVMFTESEATSLLIGLTLLRRLRVAPFPAALETAEDKLLAALPDQLQTLLAKTAQWIGFERIPADLFLLKANNHQTSANNEADESGQRPESEVVSTFLRAIFERKVVQIDYHSPYREQPKSYRVLPYGLLWDRDWWYLVGQRITEENSIKEADAATAEPWLWRADRVVTITTQPGRNNQPFEQSVRDFDVNTLLGRTWLAAAMTKWRAEAPVQLRITQQQALMLQQDWYYRYAHYEERDDGAWVMTLGEDNHQIVFDLVRWLGPGAELLTPLEWRALIYEELRAMAAVYNNG